MEGSNGFTDSFPNEVVQLYLRTVRKEAKVVTIQACIKPSELLTIVSARYSIPEERVVLFYNGGRVSVKESTLIVRNKTIVHVLDQRNLEGSDLAVSFKTHPES